MSVQLVETSSQALTATSPVASLNVEHYGSIWMRFPSGAASGGALEPGAMVALCMSAAAAANSISRCYIGGTTSTIGSWSLVAQKFDGSFAEATDASPGFAIDTWYHVFFAQPSLSSIRLYLNGSLVATDSTVQVNRTLTALDIGRLQLSGAPRQWFRGYLAEAAIFTGGSLTTGQMDTLASDLASNRPGDVTTNATLTWYRPLYAQANDEAGEVGAQDLSEVNFSGDPEEMWFPSVHPFTIFNPAWATHSNRVIGAGTAA